MSCSQPRRSLSLAVLPMAVLSMVFGVVNRAIAIPVCWRVLDKLVSRPRKSALVAGRSSSSPINSRRGPHQSKHRVVYCG